MEKNVEGSAEQVLARVPAGRGEVRVCEISFKGRTYVDVRRFYMAQDGTMLPTRKGIALAPATMDALISELVKLRDTGALPTGDSTLDEEA